MSPAGWSGLHGLLCRGTEGSSPSSAAGSGHPEEGAHSHANRYDGQKATKERENEEVKEQDQTTQVEMQISIKTKMKTRFEVTGRQDIL